MVLRGRPDHRRPADVDLLDALLDARARRDGGGERVQVADQQVERLDAELGQLVGVTRLAQVGEQTGVYRGVQRLDPTVERLRKAGQLLDPEHGHAQRLHGRGSGAGRDDPHVVGGQRPHQLGEAVLVVDRQQCAPDRPAPLGVGHGIVTFLAVQVQPSRTRRPTYSTSCRRSASLMRSVRVSSVSSPSTGPVVWALIGPVSTPASTKNRVAPATFTPYPRASRGPWMPGNAGSNALCVFRYRSPKAARNCAPTNFRNPAETTRSGRYPETEAVSARSQSA